MSSYRRRSPSESVTGTTVSTRAGSSRATSRLVRRRRKGRTRRASAARASGCFVRSMGVANLSRNDSRLPNRPGKTSRKRLHSSPSRFSTGVPESAMRASAFNARTALARAVSGFFTAWASSRMSVAKDTAAKRSASRINNV